MSSQPRLHAVHGDSWAGAPADSPTTPQSTTDSGAGSTNPPDQGSPSSSRSQKARAERSLPTDRLNFEKQVEVLRVIAQMSGNGRRPVTADDLSASIGLRGHTGGLSNKFFRDSGWVVSAGRGMYAATEPLLEYHRHLNVDPQDTDGARRHLADAAQTSWYWETVEPMLEGGARQTMILHALSKAAGAYDHMAQLQLILTWLEWLGLVRREGDLVLMGTAEDASAPQGTERASELPAEDDTASQASPEATGSAVQEPLDAQESGTPSGSTVDAETPAVDTSALVSFSFNVRITADDAAKLNAEQLKSLLEFAEKLRG